MGAPLPRAVAEIDALGTLCSAASRARIFTAISAGARVVRHAARQPPPLASGNGVPQVEHSGTSAQKMLRQTEQT